MDEPIRLENFCRCGKELTEYGICPDPDCPYKEEKITALCPRCGGYLDINKNCLNPRCGYPRTLPIGNKLKNGYYTIDRILGQGGFGITYRVTDPEQNKFAIKELFVKDRSDRNSDGSVSTPSSSESDHITKRFQREIRVLSELKGIPGIVQFREAFEENQTQYYVMDYIKGSTLESKIPCDGMKWEELWDLMEPVLDIVKKTHQKSVNGLTCIHGDIAPDNIIIDAQGKPILIDFGGAVLFEVEGNQPLHSSFIPGLAKHGYSSYEQELQLNGDKPTVLWDIYSLGATIYYGLTKKAPEVSTSREYKVSKGEKDPLNIPDNIPLYLKNVILKAMALPKQDHYQNVDELIKALNPKGEIYREAEKLIYEKKYKEAKELLQTIPDFEDAKVKAAECETFLKHSEELENYARALVLLQEGKALVESKDYPKAEIILKKAEELFRSASENPESKKNLEECAKECTYLKAEKLFSEGRLKEALVEYNKISELHDAYEKVFLCMNERTYQHAETLFRKGRFAEAKTQYERIINLRDSREKAEICGKYLLYQQAKDVFTKAEQETASGNFSFERYETAKDLFTSLSGFLDASLQVEMCRKHIENLKLKQKYAFAEAFFKNGKYSEAKISYERIKGYEDADRKAEYCGLILRIYSAKTKDDLFEILPLLYDLDESVFPQKRALIDECLRKSKELQKPDVIPVPEENQIYDYSPKKFETEKGSDVLSKKTNSSQKTLEQSKRQKTILYRILFLLVMFIGFPFNFFLFQIKNNEEVQSIETLFDEEVQYQKENNEEVRSTTMLFDENIKIGSFVMFGNYWQGNSIDEGKTPIEWQVLEIKDGKALLISKYGLDTKPYNEEWVNVTWETCTLRKWLNDDFLSGAFSMEEQEWIEETKVSLDGEPYYSYTDTGNATHDKVFLLSIQETEKYFASDDSRIAYSTKYKDERGSDYAGHCMWWLRSTGNYQDYAAYVNTAGFIFDGIPVNKDIYYVRPAMWVFFEPSLINQKDLSGIETSKETLIAETIGISNEQTMTAPAENHISFNEIEIQQETPVQMPTRSGAPTPKFGIVSVKGDSGVLIRKSPMVGGEVLRSALNDSVLELLGDRKEVNGTVWVNVRTKEDLEGWIMENTIRIANLSPEESPSTGAVELKEDIKIGDIITFGNYWQEESKDKGKTPIEWEVLDVKDGKALLISKHALDAKPYNEEHWKKVAWESCTLRRWLNGDFLNTAFSAEEQGRIAVTEVSADRNPTFDTYPGMATLDKVFLLSIQEAEKFFPSDSARACSPTEYAIAQGAFTYGHNELCWWWLRSSGGDQSNAANVNTDGSLYYGGRSVDLDRVAVRPALWVNIEEESHEQITKESTIETPVSQENGNIEVGSIVTFGNYWQGESKDEGKTSIEWQVLDIKDGKALLISKLALDSQPYDFAGQDITWEECDLRAWLNGTFADNAFSADEQAKIALTNVSSDKNPKYDTDPGTATMDKVFLLSISEAEKYFPSSSARKCYATEYAKARGGYAISNGLFCWWLRSPGNIQRNAANVNIDGSLYYIGYHVYFVTVAVRPALWINLDS